MTAHSSIGKIDHPEADLGLPARSPQPTIDMADAIDRVIAEHPGLKIDDQNGPMIVYAAEQLIKNQDTDGTIST
jgi:hypothetical protein